MDTFNRTLSHFLRFGTALLVIATLYFGREILMPLAMACLFTFLLVPLVKRLCRWGVPRGLSLAIVTVACFSTLALVAWLFGGELANLANDLPNHRQNIQRRIVSLQSIGDNKLIQSLRNLAGDVSQSAPANATPAAPAVGASATHPAAPAPAAAGGGEGALLSTLNLVVPTLAQALGTATVVILFVVFMLLRLNDISQRVARLVGYGRLTLTTKAIDESGERISRYLLMQGTVNAIYGLTLALGLTLIGLPYVVLWGALAAVSRFIPYIGSWIVTALMMSLSLAVFDGWTQPLMVLGFVVVLELLTNMLLEPMLYGHSVGLSDFALLLSIAFWTWLWGGAGLVLATPLTVCIVVFCKHAPSLEWVDIVMGENPLSLPHLSYYQYQLADNEDAAQELLETSLRKDGLEATLDNIALPALALTRREEVLTKLDHDEARQIYESMRSSLVLLQESAQPTEKAATKAAAAAAVTAADIDPVLTADAAAAPRPALQIYGRALHGEADAQALGMLAMLLPPGIALELSTSPQLIGELIQELENKKPDVVCISAMHLRAQLDVKTLCRRLRAKLPELRILVCCWHLPGQSFDPKPLRETGATWVVSSMQEAREVLESRLA
jgi:predicted PurR-regulated permease PerM